MGRRAMGLKASGEGDMCPGAPSLPLALGKQESLLCPVTPEEDTPPKPAEAAASVCIGTWVWADVPLDHHQLYFLLSDSNLEPLLEADIQFSLLCQLLQKTLKPSIFIKSLYLPPFFTSLIPFVAGVQLWRSLWQVIINSSPFYFWASNGSWQHLSEEQTMSLFVVCPCPKCQEN